MYTETKLTLEEQLKVAGDKSTFATWEELVDACKLVSGTRPRMYGYLEDVGQITKITSQQRLDEYTGRLGFAWFCHTTLADLIKPAH